jgi:hypothetical protein
VARRRRRCDNKNQQGSPCELTLRFFSWPPLSHIFFGFIPAVFMAFFICIEQPAISFCDIEDFAEVISCMATVLFSPSAIFITAASALANPSSVQFAVFDLANTGDAARRAVAIKAALNDLEIIRVNSMKAQLPVSQRAVQSEVPLFAPQNATGHSRPGLRRAGGSAPLLGKQTHS